MNPVYNILLDPAPDTYNGYLIRTDYRIGIQITQALNDPELSRIEQLQAALYLLYGNGLPDYETAINGLQWFMNGDPATTGDSGNTASGEIDCFSFDFDAGRIYTGFRRAYGIELDKVSLHWFRFLSLLGDLGECAFSRVIDYRTADLSKMDKETRKQYQIMRRKFALPRRESEEEKEFMRLLGEGG